MQQPPLRPPAQLLEPLVRALCYALEAQTQSFVRRLARPLMGLILHRIVSISHRFRRYVERIEAGRPFPRRRAAPPAQPSTPAQSSPGATPRRYAPDPLPRRVGWLGAVLPDIVPHRSHLSHILATPEMAAAIAAAPEQMGGVLRPLCRMLGLRPPPSIARPPRRKPVRQRPEPSPDAGGTGWPHDPRKRDRLGHYIGKPPLLPIEHRAWARLRSKKSS